MLPYWQNFTITWNFTCCANICKGENFRFYFKIFSYSDMTQLSKNFQQKNCCNVDNNRIKNVLLPTRFSLINIVQYCWQPWIQNMSETLLNPIFDETQFWLFYYVNLTIKQLVKWLSLTTMNNVCSKTLLNPVQQAMLIFFAVFSKNVTTYEKSPAEPP